MRQPSLLWTRWVGEGGVASAARMLVVVLNGHSSKVSYSASLGLACYATGSSGRHADVGVHACLHTHVTASLYTRHRCSGANQVQRCSHYACTLSSPPNVLYCTTVWRWRGSSPQALCFAARCAARNHLPHAAQVHARGVLHGDVELRNFVLASQPAAARGGGAAGPYPTQSSFTSLGGGYGGGTSRSSDGEQQQQQQPRAPQPCVMLLDFGLAKLVDEAAEEWGVEPAQLLQQERMELQALLRWEPPLPVPAGAGSGAEAADAAAASGGSGENAGNVKPGHNQQGSAAMCVEQVAGSPAAGISRPSPPAAVHSGRRPPAGLLPVPPPRLPCGLGGWRQQHSLRSHVPHNNLIRLQPVRHGGRGAASSSSRRTSSLRTTWGL